MTDAGALMAELHDLRRQRQKLRGHRGRREVAELRRLTRRELLIEAKLLPRASSTASVAQPPDDGRELAWWQK